MNRDKSRILTNFSFKRLGVRFSSIEDNYKSFIDYILRLLTFRYREVRFF